MEKHGRDKKEEKENEEDVRTNGTDTGQKGKEERERDTCLILGITIPL